MSALGTLHDDGDAKPKPEVLGKDEALTERVDVGCVHVTFTAVPSAVAKRLSELTDVSLPTRGGAVAYAPGRRAIWLTPRSWLIQCSIPEELALTARINGAFPDKLAHASSFTDALSWLELSGDNAGIALTRGGFVSLERDGLPVGHAKRTSLAGVAVIAVREEVSRWLLGVERSRALYFSEWLRQTCNRAAAIPGPS
jgi:heterotetrameric sarcosine oxidase gamma subunit